MGNLSINVSHDVGDLVFGADNSFHQYTCSCKMCDGEGKIDKPEGVGLTFPEGDYEYDGVDEFEDDDDDEDDWLEDDEVACPACDGYGSHDEEVEVLYPSVVGRITRISADVTIDLDDDDEERFSEISFFVSPLLAAKLGGESEMEEFGRMVRFYHMLRAGEVTDFHSCYKRKRHLIAHPNVHKSYKQSCEHVLRHNLRVFKNIYTDLSNTDFDIDENERQELVHVCATINEIQANILAIYPELQSIVPGFKPKKDKSEKDTEKIEKEDKPEEHKALMALASIEVEEALL